MSGCPYCDTFSGAGDGPPRFIDREDFVGFMGRYQPTGPDYSLVVPWAHVQDLHHLAEEQLAPMLRVVQEVSMAIVSAFDVTGTTSMQNNGPPGQRVKHLHFHVIPRHPSDGYTAESAAEVLWKSWSVRRPSSGPLSLPADGAGLTVPDRRLMAGRFARSCAGWTASCSRARR